MLAVDNLSVGYGEGLVIRNLSLSVGIGESVAVLGRNGMGKTTLFKALIGMIPSSGGSVKLQQQELVSARSYQRVAAGMGYVPQGRMIFPYLTVEENILTGMDRSPMRTVPAFVYKCFPVLEEMRRRRGGNLSGGQQQQLAIARALVTEPKVLLLDEPTEGIQPSINKEIARTLKRLKSELGFSLLLSEQALKFALEVADRFVVLERGEIVYQATAATLNLDRVHAFLTLATDRDEEVSPTVAVPSQETTQQTTVHPL
jgi:urea transport system ATP-binding protein